MNKIQRVSLFFRVLFQVLFMAIPIVSVIAWMNAPNELVFMGGVFRADMIPRAYSHDILHTLTAMEKFFGFILSLIPNGIEMFIAYSFICLFKLFEHGEIFAINNVKYIRNIGYALLLDQLLNPIYEGFMGIILTMNNPHGHRFAKITLDQTNLGIILTGIFIILISWIMAEG